MPQEIEIVAQDSMDLFYQNYKSNSDFFDIEDFVRHCSGVMAGYYNQMYERARAEMRQERRDEIISFDADILLPQILKIKEDKDAGELYADLEFPVMSFPFDEHGVGVQDIYAKHPNNKINFERTTATAKYQLKYVPACPVIWFYKSVNRIRLINKTTTKLMEIVALTVPSVANPKLQVPDAIVEYVVTTAAATIKQAGQAVVVKKSEDENPNKLPQTEINLSSLK